MKALVESKEPANIHNYTGEQQEDSVRGHETIIRYPYFNAAQCFSNECTAPNPHLIQGNASPAYQLNLSNNPLLLTSLFLLPPGSALVQSTMSPASTPNMLSLLIALTNATSHAPLLTENVLNGTVVSGFCAMFLSAGSVKGARPLRVSE
jgi:hypothetical protein